ncbi:ArsR family transcriptional regulator [candidate division TA06 bacterium DG_26]|uniref:ArsR family transcriptional regulator n=1 Tax=candidate division TA06 bacterium DG_26 TaxID=1703771 RepID=A0A0S7WIC3_UNCT6|nr:MAG: ArsR family transcriptional regulator [candidate division TA06 bacterium DG_26]
MQVKYEVQSEILKAMANPVRLQILMGLLEDECNVSRIQKNLGIPQSTISQHLRILRDKGIIQGRREGTKICYRVIDRHVRDIVDILKKR